MDPDSLETKHVVKPSNQWIQTLKFDPRGDYLAVGSHDNHIYLFATTGVMESDDPPALTATCTGHTSFITHIDWTVDGAYLRSNCGAYELLFW